MNVELLRKVQKAILEEPLRINMDNWAFTPGEQELMDQTPRCGTVGCIAGWTIAIQFNLFDSDGDDTLADYGGCYEMAAMSELGLSNVQSNRLFYPHLWPEKFRLALDIRRGEGDHDPKYPHSSRLISPGGSLWEIGKRAGTPEYAQIVADRIEHFIQTEGEE